MGIGDSIRNKAEELAGKGKEKLGEATDNDKMQSEGKKDQGGSQAKEGLNKLGDAAKDTFGGNDSDK